MKYWLHRIAFCIVLLFLGCGGSVEKQNQSQLLRLRNIYDAFGHGDDGAQFDFGFSVLVEYKGTTILIDSGTDADILEKTPVLEAI